MKRWWLRFVALSVLVLAGLLLDALLQGRTAADLDVGGQDLGYVRGFSAKEWSDTLPGAAGPEAGTYRWMGQSGVLFLGPVRAGRPLVLRLRMFSGRPAADPWPEVRLEVQGRSWVAFPLSPSLTEYAFLLPPEALSGEDLVVRLEVETFRVEGDPRDLGCVMDGARLESLGASTGQTWPWPAALRPTYGLAVPAVALAALALGVAYGPACGMGIGFLALAGAATAWKPGLALRAGPTLLVLSLLALGLAGLLRLLGPRWRSWARWLGDHAGLVLPVCFLLGLLVAFFPHIEADGIEYYAYLRSLAFDGDLHFDNELSLDTPFPHVPYGLGAKKTATGYAPNYASVGPAIVWAPFFALGHLLALGGSALGLPWTLDGYSQPYVVLICFGSTVSALVTLFLGYDLVRRLYGRPLGLLATVTTFLGTPIFYYAFYKPDFAHALAACAVTVFVSIWMRTRGARGPRQWLWLGLAAGFVTTLYWIDAIAAALPALELLVEGVGALRARRWHALVPLLRGGAIFLLAFLVGFSPQMIAWKIIFGRWLTVPQEGFATPAGFAGLDLILSPLHGLIPWTPLALLGIVGLVLPVLKKRPWGAYVLAVMLAIFIYNASLGSWHGGGTFGLRRLTDAFPFFLLGVAALLEQVRRWRPAGALLVAILPTFWSLMVLLRYLAYAIPHYPSELQGLSLAEFLFAPDNMPLARLPEVLRLSFFVQWGMRLQEAFRPAMLLYGLILLALFVGTSVAMRRGLIACLGVDPDTIQSR